MHLACIVFAVATAAAGAGVPDRLFQYTLQYTLQKAWSLAVRIGQGGYVKDSLETRLSVTKRLGI